MTDRNRFVPWAILMVAAVVAGLVVLGSVSRPERHIAPESICVVDGTRYQFSTVQAANAATITAVGRGRSLPDRAVVIALATALQESRLVNLDHGDRDSVGLFQQRPSQGWGAPDRLQDPRYAAGKFYQALVRVPHWQTMPLTRAAQAVQQSGFPDEYAKWEPRASALAGALLGTRPAGLRCQFPPPAVSAASAAPTRASRATDVITALRRDYATAREVDGRGATADVTPADWATASWLVAHAESLSVESVSFDGRTWTRARGERGWAADPHARPDRIRLTVAGTQ